MQSAAWIHERDTLHPLTHTLLVTRWNIIRQTGPNWLHSPSHFPYPAFRLITAFSDAYSMLEFIPNLHDVLILLQNTPD